MDEYTINPFIPGAIFKKKFKGGVSYWSRVANIDSIQGLTFSRSTNSTEQKQIENYIHSHSLFQKIINDKKTIFFPCNE